MKLFKSLSKFFKFTRIHIPIELFMLFKVPEMCLAFWKFNNTLIFVFYIDMISVALTTILSLFTTIQNIIRLRKPNFKFINWVIGKENII